MSWTRSKPLREAISPINLLVAAWEGASSGQNEQNKAFHRLKEE
jgi:hypothetical protein